MTKVTITGLRYLNNCKTVFAYGLSIDVPNNIRFLTIDLYGILKAWDTKPEQDIPFYDWIVPHSPYKGIMLGKIRYTGDWTDSLVELPSE